MNDRPHETQHPVQRRATARRYALTAAMVLVPLLTGATGYVIGRGGLRPGRVAPAKTDQDVLAALREYDPAPELDERGRVSKLKLEGRHVDDAALDEVAKLTALKHLSLRDSSVTDAGLLKLAGLKRLESLGITDTRATNVGLTQLASMASLRFVWVTESGRLTRSGVESLKKSLPGVQVYVMNPPEKKKEPAATAVNTKQ